MSGDISVFDRFARVYDLAMPSADAEALSAGLARAERPVDTVLDVGGGSGRGVAAVQAPERVVVDAARGMLRGARDHGLEAVQGDATRLPVRSGSADAVLIVDALHHVGDREAALAECAHALAPGGVLVVADFDPETLRGRATVAAEHLVGFESSFLTPWALVDEVESAGLDPSVVRTGFGYVVAGVA